eukprot:CAMPEP_0118921866 /NCGR_PEP_ID=MMETSP1169-20130426/1003_1 /TAXON_ID=36882 /ORGANISM="Pyramimonas obovata, Strain CCMP722" /LENGTH=356 /DNA_ID=CAMNT_0006862657 /DNA_START=77 /DNA_END=1147 /DNA_ORIENTATION=+
MAEGVTNERVEEVDEDRATKRFNPVVDHGLGTILLLLIARFIWFLYDVRAEQPELAMWFAGALVATVVAITVVTRASLVFGIFVSRLRSGDWVPEECKNPLASKVAQHKFKDQAWQLAVHATMSAWELRLLLQHRQWWDDPASCFAFYPKGEKPAILADELRMFYIVQLVIWMWTGVSCKWLEERRKDYLEMMTHHVLTVGLLLTSLESNELPIGLVVLAIHDSSDVVLDLMKMANYLKLEGLKSLFFVEILFVLNYITFGFSRLYIFPVKVISAVLFGYNRRCKQEHHSNCYPHYVPIFFASMLSGLLVLHVFWMYLLSRIFYKIIIGKPPNEAGDEEYEITMTDDDGNEVKKSK